LVDDATHLEPTNLPDHDAVLDVGRRSGSLDDGHQLQMLRRGRRRLVQRLGHHGQQEAILREPDRDREREPLGPAREQTGVVLDDEVQCPSVLANRPGERGAE